MKPRYLERLTSLLLFVALVAPPSAMACGEGIYIMRPGLRHQGYLAPNLATVLVYNNQETVPAATKAVYRGLVQAGHTVEVARTPEQLANALRERRYDVVIADFDQIEAIGKHVDSASKTKLLPIATKGQRSANDWRGRFHYLLEDRASLGQYLKLINQLVKDRA
ncbi:MAG TPA: hypothetical protein VM469_13390 [Pseudoxanthomonas sp.]|nr:hypothetical protein [Pseudoxanthomonas sp.]